MNIDATYKRAVRIIGKPGDTHGIRVYVYDATSEEQITNVKEARIHLNATGVSIVVLEYYATDEQGAIITDAQKEPIQEKTTIISEKHEIDVTAWEVQQSTSSITAELVHDGVMYKGRLYAVAEDKER